MFFNNKGVIGIDIGSNAIKLAELKLSGGGYRLKNIGEALLPNDSILNKVIKDKDAVAETLLTLLQDLQIKAKNIAVSISGNSVIIKKVNLPKMTERELQQSISWELEQYLPQNMDEVNYDFQILSDAISDDGNMEVLIVAGSKDTIDGYTSLVSTIGLNPVAVDVDVFALEHMYKINYETASSIVALVNIGACVTNINIIADGVSIFTRDVVTGGEQFTKWLIEELNVSYNEAEAIKYSLKEQGNSEEIDKIFNDFTDLITGEIKRTIDFFSSNFQKEKVGKIVLSGGSSKLPKIKELLQRTTGVEVEPLNPFRNIEYSDSVFDSEYLDDIAPKMGVAVGLASREALL